MPHTKHLEDAVTTQRMLGLFADHLRNNPCNPSDSRHVGLILRHAGMYAVDYAIALASGLEPFDAMNQALGCAMDKIAVVSFNNLVLRE
jgi:hypothetical protein